MNMIELRQLVKVATDMGVTEVKLSDGRDGVESLIDISGTIKMIGPQHVSKRTVVFSSK